MTDNEAYIKIEKAKTLEYEITRNFIREVEQLCDDRGIRIIEYRKEAESYLCFKFAGNLVIGGELTLFLKERCNIQKIEFRKDCLFVRVAFGFYDDDWTLVKKGCSRIRDYWCYSYFPKEIKEAILWREMRFQKWKEFFLKIKMKATDIKTEYFEKVKYMTWYNEFDYIS